MERKDFIAIFIAETKDNLTALDNGLVALEKDPNNIDIIREMNRNAHTIKGSARALGFYEIQEIAHKIEDIFDKISQKRLIFTSQIADSVFKGVDAMKAMLDKVAKDEVIDLDITSICKLLEEAAGEEISKTEGGPSSSKEEFKGEVEEKSSPLSEGGSYKTSPQKKTSQKSQVKIEEYIRVPLARVNNLLNLVGELVINKMKSSQKVKQAKEIFLKAKDLHKKFTEAFDKIKTEGLNGKFTSLFQECNIAIQMLREESLQLYDNVSTETLHVDPVIDELQSKVKEIRMLPISTIFEGFIRMVRDISHSTGKEVNLEISGEDTELDKKVLEGVKAPLMHILRNCIDHGIETPDEREKCGKPRYGTIKLSAYHEAGNVVIEVEDDGKGIDAEKVKSTCLKKHLVTEEEIAGMDEKEILNLIFINGFSTSPIITDVSGRGIGLDVVRKEIEHLKGQVSLETEVGKGTKFTLILPLTIAIIQVLLVRIGKYVFAVPLLSIEECIRVKKEEVSTIEGRMAFHLRGHTVPLVKMKDVLRLESEDEEKSAKEYLVIIATSLDKRVGFIVDAIVGEEEIFIKSLGDYLGKLDNVAGATILGTGEVIVILDVADLIANSRLSHPAISAGKKIITREKKTQKWILVVEDSLSTRELIKGVLESQGYQVVTAVDGLDGLDKLGKGKFNIVVTDVQMPRMDGFELCRIIKSKDEYQGISVIIVTALEKEEDKRRGIEVGADAYIVKSGFDQRNLLDTIERLIG